MKTKILTLALMLAALIGWAQVISYVDVTTKTTNTVTHDAMITISNGVPSSGTTNANYHSVDTNNVITGDTLLTAFTKINADLLLLTNLLGNLNTSVAFYIYFETNGLSVHSGIYTNGTYYGRFIGTGTFTNSWMTNSTFTNCTFAGNGTYLTSLNGANLISSTVNSNAFDTLTLAWLQSCIVPGINFTAGNIIAGTITGTSFSGSLIDNGASSGGSGYLVRANGDGTWTWTAAPTPDVVPDSNGAGGTTLHLKAINDGSDQYLHIDNAGTITVTTSP